MAGTAALAFAACVALGMVMSAPSGVQNLHVAAAPAMTRVATPLVASVGGSARPALYRQATAEAQEAVYQAPAFQMAETAPAPAMNGGLLAGLAGVFLAPMAVVAAYFAGRKSTQEGLKPIQMDAVNYNSYAMMATAGAVEEEAGETEDIADLDEAGEVEVEDVPIETSYAKIIANIEQQYLKEDLPKIYVGDTVKVGVTITEGNKTRVQPYQGVVIAERNSGLHKAITVRAVLQGVGVERVFPVHCSQVAWIKVISRGKVRRAKLYYLRDRVGKAARLKTRFDRPL